MWPLVPNFSQGKVTTVHATICVAPLFISCSLRYWNSAISVQRPVHLPHQLMFLYRRVCDDPDGTKVNGGRTPAAWITPQRGEEGHTWCASLGKRKFGKQPSSNEQTYLTTLPTPRCAHSSILSRESTIYLMLSRESSFCHTIYGFPFV